MIVKALVRLFSSLRLTVVCLALAAVLVFVGTMAQVEQGLYAVQAKYFQSFFVFWELPGTGLRIPVFPGGYLIGGVLVINLLVAYGVRFGLKRLRPGLILIHSGLVLLLLGQLWTDLSQQESVMQLAEGQTKSYSESQRRTELAIIDPSHSDHDHVVAIPEAHLRTGAEMRHPQLPFAIKVLRFWANSAPIRGHTNTVADPFAERPPVTTTDSRNVPAAQIELIGTQGSLGKRWVSEWFMEPETLEHDGKRYQLALRLARYYKPFAITLLEARHDKYKGTEIPRNFSSRVRLRPAGTTEDRETLIYMNNPLRYGGFTFYQYQMAADEALRRQGQRATSTLQVVRNPGWLVPYIACILVGLGLTWQFTTHLLGFVRQRSRRAPSPAASSPALPTERRARRPRELAPTP